MTIDSFVILTTVATVAPIYIDYGTKFLYGNLVKNNVIKADNHDIFLKAIQKGLYHITSEENIDSIVSSGFLYPSSKFDSYTFTNKKRRCFFFAGEPSLENFCVNAPRKNVSYKLTALKIKPSYEQLASFNIREYSDKAIAYEGTCQINDYQYEKVGLVMELDDQKNLIYKEVSNEVFKNYQISDDVIKKLNLNHKRISRLKCLALGIKGEVFNYFWNNAVKKVLTKFSLKRENPYNGLVVKPMIEINNQKTTPNLPEQNFFVDLIEYANLLKNVDCDKEFNKKRNLKQFNSVNFDNNLDINSLDSYLDYLNIKDDLITDISNIKTEYLYKSKTHGIGHNLKVMLFSSLLSKDKQLNDVDTKIVMDAAKYHDIGRVNDSLDSSHGLRSAEMIDKVMIDDVFYQNNENSNLLKAIMEIHSIEDQKENDIIDKYQITDYERFRKLYSIVKDADALDRVRLSMNTPFSSELNVNYLRNPEAYKLIKLSHQVNTIYKDIFGKKMIVNTDAFEQEMTEERISYGKSR